MIRRFELTVKLTTTEQVDVQALERRIWMHLADMANPERQDEGMLAVACPKLREALPTQVKEEKPHGE